MSGVSRASETAGRGLSAIALFDAPNVAVGDALGSCVFNLFILVVLELLARGESL